ncbi:hypothetical protein M885DRAFT_602442 [Pelagophyceae sp. CCMP2097]|nr:hypothetical protein M885DRAFT_602442 [Pelagophyceae sp. CCMP2097]
MAHLGRLVGVAVCAALSTVVSAAPRRAAFSEAAVAAEVFARGYAVVDDVDGSIAAVMNRKVHARILELAAMNRKVHARVAVGDCSGRGYGDEFSNWLHKECALPVDRDDTFAVLTNLSRTFAGVVEAVTGPDARLCEHAAMIAYPGAASFDGPAPDAAVCAAGAVASTMLPEDRGTDGLGRHGLADVVARSRPDAAPSKSERESDDEACLGIYIRAAFDTSSPFDSGADKGTEFESGYFYDGDDDGYVLEDDEVFVDDDAVVEFRSKCYALRASVADSAKSEQSHFPPCTWPEKTARRNEDVYAHVTMALFRRVAARDQGWKCSGDLLAAFSEVGVFRRDSKLWGVVDRESQAGAPPGRRAVLEEARRVVERAVGFARQQAGR